VSGLRTQLQELYSSVLSGVIEPGVGAVAAQITNAQIRLIQTERRIKETDELARQVEDLTERFGA
jgi:glutamate racemase